MDTLRARRTLQTCVLETEGVRRRIITHCSLLERDPFAVSWAIFQQLFF